MAGYSDKSLKEKLGLRDDMSTYFLRAPQEYWQELGFKQAPYDDNTGEYEFIHAFFTLKEEMSNFSDILVSKLSQNGMLWISWPKMSARKDIPSDITEQDLRDAFLPLGVVDVKVCAVTEQWSALKFVFRKFQPST
jgi:hypothetical protein